MPLVPDVKNVDISVKRAIQGLSKKLGYTGSPTHANITLTDLTASSLVGTNANKLLESVTVSTGLDYTRPTLSLSHLGIEALTDPGADRIFFWDNSESASKWLAVGNSIAITTTTIDTIQDIRTTASPTFAGLTITNAITEFSTDATLGDNSDSALPTEKAVKAYVDLAVGAAKDYYLSDNDDPSIANYHILYETDTGGAASTEVTAAMGENDDQLMFSFITPAGVPGVTFLRTGVYILHTHLARTTGNKPTTFYWTYSKYALDTTETVLMTSETSTAIPGSIASFRTHATLTADETILDTDRLVLKLYANVGAAGADSVITIYMEGTHDCHITNLLPSSIWQTQGDVLDAINALGDIADNEFLVGTGAGTLAWESGATLRTSIGLDTWAGTANITTLGTIATGVWEGTSISTTYTDAKCTDATADNTAGNETSHATVVVDGDFTSNGILNRTGAGVYSILALGTDVQAYHANLAAIAGGTWTGAASITTLGTIATGTWQATDVGIAYGGTGQSTAQLAINALSAVSGATNEHVLTKDTATGNAVFKVAAGGGATTALDNLASVAINTSLISDTQDTDSLGSATKEWLNLYIGDAGRIYLGLGQDISLHRSAANTLFITASSLVSISGSLLVGGIISIGDADVSETELEILDGCTASTTQLNFLNQAGGVTGTDSTNIVFSTSPTLVTPTLGVATATALFLTEQAAAEEDVEGKGQFWVKTVTPNQPWFTDDAGNDYQLNIIPSGCRARLAGNQTITTDTWTKLTLATEDWDDNNEFDSAVNYMFTAKTAGKYLVVVVGRVLALAANKSVASSIYKNQVLFTTNRVWTPVIANIQCATVEIMDLQVNDDIEGYIWHEHGGDRTADAQTYLNYMTIQKLP